MLRTQTQSSPLLRTRTQSSPSPRTRIQRTKWSLTSRQGYILRSFPKTQKDAILGILMQSSPFSFPLLKFFPLHLHLNFFRQQLFPPTKLFCIIYTPASRMIMRKRKKIQRKILTIHNWRMRYYITVFVIQMITYTG